MRNLLLPLLMMFLPLILEAQTITLTLDEAIKRAKEFSPEAVAAKARLRAAEWEQQAFRSELLPQLSLRATLPDFDRSIRTITLPTGEDAFVPRSQVFNNVSLQLNQNIFWTGGSVFVRSGLSRIDVFGANSRTTYLNQPFVAGFRQPLFAFNPYKWQRKLMPLQLEQAERDIVQQLENVAGNAVNFFFDLYIAELNVGIAQNNVANNDTLYKISIDRYEIGRIAQNELLQMELNLLNAQTELQSAQIELAQAIYNLKAYLKIDENTEVDLVPPSELPGLEIPLERAMAEAMANNSRSYNLRLRNLEAQMLEARARTATLPQAEISVSVGLTQQTNTHQNLYQNVQDQENVMVGLTVPILNWGGNKARYEVVRAEQEALMATTEFEQERFEQEVRLFVQRFRMMPHQVAIAAKADTVAQQQFEVAKNRYLIGKISITDLNVAVQQKDLSKQRYWQVLRNYWGSYYTLRQLTLYDFEENVGIRAE